MTYTYDLSANGVLIIRADEAEREWLKNDIRGPVGEYGETNRPYNQIELDALEPLLCNSELEWIEPYEIAALTDAPILGIRGSGEADEAEGDVVAAWGYMDYQVRSFVDDLIETGKAVFVS